MPRKQNSRAAPPRRRMGCLAWLPWLIAAALAGWIAQMKFFPETPPGKAIEMLRGNSPKENNSTGSADEDVSGETFRRIKDLEGDLEARRAELEQKDEEIRDLRTRLLILENK